MTSEQGKAARQFCRGIATLLGCFMGLCSVFALIATAAGAWEERAEAHWPEAMASVEACGLDLYRKSTGRGPDRPEAYYIDCRLSYGANGKTIVTKVKSRHSQWANRAAWPDPWIKIRQMQAWVDGHPEGTLIAVHYKPANPKTVALVGTDMPLGESRTPDNLMLLEFFAAACAVLLTIARVVRP